MNPHSLPAGRLVPRRGCLIVRLEQAPKTTSSGIYIPERDIERPLHAVVVAVGLGEAVLAHGTAGAQWHERPVDYSVGERVLFTKYVGDEVDIDGVPHLILQFHDVLGTLIESTVSSEEH